MTNNFDLLKGTIILEALNYTGEIKPVVMREGLIPGEIVGPMNEMEKRLHTLSVLKNEEIRLMFEDLSSDLPDEVSGEERRKHLSEIITSKEDFHLYQKFNRLQKEASACHELMITLIQLRFIDINLILEIRPGFQIVSLPNTELLVLGIPGNTPN